MALGDLPVGPYRALVKRREAEGWPLSDIALKAGFINNKGGRQRGDQSRLKRAVGWVDYQAGNNKRYRQETLTYETAARIVRACDFDPVDFDI